MKRAPDGFCARPLVIDWAHFELDLSTHEDDPAAVFVPKRPINRDVASSRSFGRADMWLFEVLERQVVSLCIARFFQQKPSLPQSQGHKHHL